MSAESSPCYTTVACQPGTAQTGMNSISLRNTSSLSSTQPLCLSIRTSTPSSLAATRYSATLDRLFKTTSRLLILLPQLVARRLAPVSRRLLSLRSEVEDIKSSYCSATKQLHLFYPGKHVTLREPECSIDGFLFVPHVSLLSVSQSGRIQFLWRRDNDP